MSKLLVDAKDIITNENTVLNAINIASRFCGGVIPIDKREGVEKDIKSLTEEILKKYTNDHGNISVFAYQVIDAVCNYYYPYFAQFAYDENQEISMTRTEQKSTEGLDTILYEIKLGDDGEGEYDPESGEENPISDNPFTLPDGLPVAPHPLPSNYSPGNPSNEDGRPPYNPSNNEDRESVDTGTRLDEPSLTNTGNDNYYPPRQQYNGTNDPVRYPQFSDSDLDERLNELPAASNGELDLPPTRTDGDTNDNNNNGENDNENDGNSEIPSDILGVLQKILQEIINQGSLTRDAIANAALKTTDAISEIEKSIEALEKFIVEALTESIQSQTDEITEAISKSNKEISESIDKITDAVNESTESSKSIVDSILSGLSTAIDSSSKLLGEIIDSVGDGISKAYSTATSLLEITLSGIESATIKVGENILKLGTNVTETVASWFEVSEEDFMTWVKKFVEFTLSTRESFNSLKSES